MTNNNDQGNKDARSSFNPDDKEIAEIIGTMTEDQKSYFKFVLRQIELDTDFAKWFKAGRVMNWKQRFVFDKKVNAAISKKAKRDD